MSICLEKLLSIGFTTFEYLDYVFAKGFVTAVDRKFDYCVIGGTTPADGGIDVDAVLEGGTIDAACLRMVGLMVELAVHG